MRIVDVASEIFLELSEPSDVSVASITQKLRFSIGDLNNLINQGFTLNSSYEIISDSGAEIDLDAVSLLKKLYEIYYYKKQSTSFLGANGVDSIQSIDQNGVKVTLVQRNQTAKSYNDLYKEAKNDLKTLINNYKFNRSIAKQIEGDDSLTNIGKPLINPLNNSSYGSDIGFPRNRSF